MTPKLEKKFQTIGKRLIKITKKNSIGLEERNGLNKYKVIGDKAYFTNGRVAMKFKNGLFEEDLAIEGLAQDNTYPVNIEKLFMVLNVKHTLPLPVKETMKLIRDNKKDYEKGTKVDFGLFEEYKEKSMVNFEITNDKLVLVKGTNRDNINFDFHYLYDTLAMLDALGEKEVTCHIAGASKRSGLIVTPMLLVTESMDAMIAPIRVD